METKKWSTILVVDDQIENLQIINRYLDEAGLSDGISLAPSAKIAFSIIEKSIPDLIITDWEMPEITGIQFIQELKKHTATKDIPVMMSTGIMTSSEQLKLAMETGAVDFIRKPIDKTELIARVKSNLLLSKKYHEVKVLNETKNKLFAIISHDVKGPLGAVLSLSDILVDEFDILNKEETKENHILLNNGLIQIYNIVENLLSWSISQSNLVNLNPSVLHIKPIIDEIFNNFSLQTKEKNIYTNIECHEYTKAYGDSEIIQIILRNLTTNAMKFTKHSGSITIKAVSNDKECVISVIDTGVGISKNKMDGIFDFTKSESTYGTNNEKGTGLGLSICKEFVELHGGKIWLESVINKGSSFNFSLPNKKM